MALVVAGPSILTGLKENIARTRLIGTTEAVKAKAQINADADFTTTIADDEAIRMASVATGLETEIIQDELAKLALHPATYPNYLARKEEVLGTIRAEVIRSYIRNKALYESVGYSEKQAGKMAADIAKDVKASQMKYYHILFPHSGEKVKQVY